MVISKISMKDIESRLSSHGFMRVHRSFLVSVRHIKAFNNDEIEVGSKSLPIGRSYKLEVISNLSDFQAN